MRKKIIETIFICVCLLCTSCTGYTQTQSVLSVADKPNVQTAVLSGNSSTVQEIQPKEAVKNITIASVGDIMMHEAEIKSGNLGNGKYDYSIIFRSIKPYIEKADFALGNLETTLSGQDKNYTGYPLFNSPEILAKNIKDAGFDMVTTANNHCLDRGFYGVEKTIDNLDNAGLLHIGTYKTDEESKSIFIKDINGVKVAFLAYTYGTNGNVVSQKFAVNLIDRGKIFEDIKRAKSLNADMIIASMHFGIEYKTTKDKTQEDLVNFLFANGVDVVLGSHPHVLEPVEMKKVKDIYGVEKDRFVIYSQGNIVANMPSRYMNSGVIVNLDIRKDKDGTTLDKVEYIPTIVDSSYNSSEKKTTFEILPVFNGNDYPNNKKLATIKQSFDDSVKILKADSPKIALKAKE